MSVAVIGHTTLDTVSTPDSGPVERLGGTPLYAQRALRSAGVEPLLVTKGPRLTDALVLPSRGLVRSILRHYPGGLVQRLDEVGPPFTADEMRTLADGPLRGYEWVLLGGQAGGDFPPAAIAVLVDAGHSVLLDGQGLSRGPRPGPVRTHTFPPATVAGVTALKLNRNEADAFAGPQDLDGLGIPELLVTDGRRGVSVRHAGATSTIRPAPVEFADPVGAGDSFAALYALGRSRGLEPAAAAESAVRQVEALYGADGAPSPGPIGA